MSVSPSPAARNGAQTSVPNPVPLKAQADSPHVIIVGGGFGGLQAAQALANAPVRVTLIDKSNHHVFQPMLYQVATGQLSGDQIASPIRNILRKQKNTDVLLGEVTGVDTQNKCVQMSGMDVPYDYLILATGSHYNYFGHPEWEQYAPSLKNLNDATRIRANILQAFEEAEKAVAEERATPEEVKAMLTFALVGAGPTGVEMCGAIAELARHSMTRDFRHIDPKSARILLLEADKRILGGFPEDLANDTLKKLQQMGVEVKTDAKVEQVDAEGVVVNGERIRTGTVLWTAGTVASDAGEWLNAEMDKAKRVKVAPDLSVPGHPEVFVIGDTAYTGSHGVKNLFFQPEQDSDKPLPGVAQPAMQMGRYAGNLIRRRVEGFNPPPPFRYWDKGNLATVGRSFAVADLGQDLKFSGFFAWLLWLGIHIFYLIGFENRFIVLAQWAFTYITYGRSVRIFEPNEQASKSAKTVMHEMQPT